MCCAVRCVQCNRIIIATVVPHPLCDPPARVDLRARRRAGRDGHRVALHCDPALERVAHVEPVAGALDTAAAALDAAAAAAIAIAAAAAAAAILIFVFRFSGKKGKNWLVPAVAAANLEAIYLNINGTFK